MARRETDVCCGWTLVTGDLYPYLVRETLAVVVAETLEDRRPTATGAVVVETQVVVPRAAVEALRAAQVEYLKEKEKGA